MYQISQLLLSLFNIVDDRGESVFILEQFRVPPVVREPPFGKHRHRTPDDVSEALIATLEAVPTFACCTVRVTSVS
jgi:hypothetical protein